jgi:hypothetical protein
LIVATLAGVAFAADPWPGGGMTNAVNLTSLATNDEFATELSDLYWNPVKKKLWIARGGAGRSVFTVLETSPGVFVLGNKYASIANDNEGITQVDDATDIVYVLDESGVRLRAWNAPPNANQTNASATLLRTWNLNGVIPGQSGNAGPEGIAFVPNACLLESQFVSSVSNAAFPASGKNAGGIFFIAHQSGGFIYAVDINLNDANDISLVGQYAGKVKSQGSNCNLTESSALAFDRSTCRLYISHNVCGNRIEVASLSSQSVAGESFQRFDVSAEFNAPNGSNIEGFAVTPQKNDLGEFVPQRAFFADDAGNPQGLFTFAPFVASLNIDAGNQQNAITGTAVAVAPRVRLLDAFKTPIAQATIDFQVSAGNGTLARNTKTTDVDGRASTGAWVLGNVGANSVFATAANTRAATQTFNATALAAVAPACPFDADQSGDAHATSDGLLLTRGANNQIENALTNFALASNATVRGAETIATYIRHHAIRLDLDDNGAFDLTDALIALRYMLGLRGNELTNGLALTGARDAAQIAAYVSNACR